MGNKVKFNHRSILIDTCTFIDYMRKDVEIQAEFAEIGEENLCFSIVTVAELYGQSVNKEYLQALKSYLRRVTIYALDKDISKRFKELIEANPHRTRWIPDALIAATALEYNLPLFTRNRRDFDFIPGLKLHKPKKLGT